MVTSVSNLAAGLHLLGEYEQARHLTRTPWPAGSGGAKRIDYFPMKNACWPG
jgi:hypothetical protein